MQRRVVSFSTLAVVSLLGFAVPDRSAGAADCDPAQVAAVREAAEARCPCAAATNHDAYVDCVADVATEASDQGLLPRRCRTDVVRCASRSTCGKPGFVTCCFARSSGGERCQVRRSADLCMADGGTPGSCPSCCDACDGTCPGSSTTTTAPPTTTSTSSTSTTTAAPTTTTTSTTLPGPVCGNGMVEAGEDCDPPGSASCPGGSPGGALLCDAECRCPAPPTTTTTGAPTTTTSSTTSSTSTTTMAPTTTTAAPTTTTSTSTTTSTTQPGPVCGNDVVEAGEDCDPPGSACPGGSPGGALLCDAECQCPAPPTTTTTGAPTTTTTSTSTTSTTLPTTTTSTVAPTTTTTTTAPTTTSTTTTSTTTTSTTAPTTTSTTTTSTTTSTTSTTTSTTSTTTTSTTTSTTTTTLAVCSCCGFSQMAFTTGIGQGTCGTVLNSSGTALLNLACGGLYFGGGQNSVPLPALVPDMGTSITNITACNESTGQLTLAGASSADTGDIRTCTTAGCLFGPPLPIPNTNSAPTSTCVVNSVASDAAGTADCDTGTQTVDLPLNAQIYLTGDLLPLVTGIQPCPICVNERCQGGPNDGDPCMPGSSDLGDAYPTSHDCPPPAELDIGGLPIPFLLTTGTSSDTAVASGTLQRVFCGFCRDQNALGTGNFENPARPCATGADCTDPNFPDCEQRTNGAFSAGAARTITATGAAAGSCLADGAQAATLVSTFCIPPTFNATVDNAADLPGPGAVSLPGTTQLLP